MHVNRPHGYGVVRSLSAVDDLLAGKSNPWMACQNCNSRNSALVSVTGLPSMETSRLAESMTIP